MRVASFLLCIVHKIPDDVQKYYLQLVSRLLLYDISEDDIHLLLRLALVSPHEAGNVLRLSLQDGSRQDDEREKKNQSTNTTILSGEEIENSVETLVKGARNCKCKFCT